MRFETNSAEETRALGEKLVTLLAPGDVVALEGDLGSGKTELVRGLMDALDPLAIVRSPSFSLVNSYETEQFVVNHFDFYRLGGADELFEIGFDEYVNAQSVCLIEWAEMFEEALPSETKYIRFIAAAADHRVIESDIDFS